MAAGSRSVRLSKTSIACLEQCHRKFWLRMHKPQTAQFTDTTRRVFAIGHLVGELARRCYPSGTLVEHDHNNLAAAISQTRSLVDDTNPKPIFEGAFYYRNMLVRADILIPTAGGSWQVVEVKNSGSVRPAYVSDLASQVWVMKGAGLDVSGMYIRHPLKPLRPWAAPHPLSFINVDVAKDVASAVQLKSDTVARGIEVANGAMPETALGEHCSKPYRCEYLEFCRRLRL